MCVRNTWLLLRVHTKNTGLRQSSCVFGTPDYCSVYIRRIQAFGNFRVCSQHLIIASCTYEEYRTSAIFVCVRNTWLLLRLHTKNTDFRQSSCVFGTPEYCFVYIRRIEAFGKLRVYSEHLSIEGRIPLNCLQNHMT